MAKTASGTEQASQLTAKITSSCAKIDIMKWNEITVSNLITESGKIGSFSAMCGDLKPDCGIDVGDAARFGNYFDKPDIRDHFLCSPFRNALI